MSPSLQNFPKVVSDRGRCLIYELSLYLYREDPNELTKNFPYSSTPYDMT